MFESGYGGLAIYRRLLREMGRYRRHIVGMLALSLLASPISLLSPVPLAIVLDSVLGSHPLPDFFASVVPGWATDTTTGILLVAVALTLGLALLRELQVLGTELLGTYTGEQLRLRFRAKLFRHVQRLSLAYHDIQGTADSNYRIDQDSSSIKWIVTYGIVPFITAGATVAGMIFVTAMIDWQLALVAIAVSPPLYLLTRASSRRLRSEWGEAKKLESSALGIVQEVLTGLRVVKVFTQEEREHERFMARSKDGARARIRIALIQGRYGLAVGFTLGVGMAAVLYLGARSVESGRMSAGELVVILGYMSQLYAPLRTLGSSLGMLQNSIAGAERAFRLLAEEPEVPERPDALALPRARGDIAFRELSFAYGDGRPVLDDISLEITAGTRVGISGATGAGKTTLASLLTRFYDPTAGCILLDGIDLRDYKLADLRNQFGIVLQEPVLFSTTIAENIAYARPDASMGEIIESARAANAHDFISSLPEGYDTLVGERGMQLSGGERQRISLARAFLKDAPILILDEPTSSVDVKTEAVIMEAMERLMRTRTTLMIAHRLTTLENCDLRVEISDGVIPSATARVLKRR